MEGRTMGHRTGADPNGKEEGTVSYRYSRKDYFDPLTSLLPASRDYRQWNYTREDGKTVLLVLGEETARLYADLPEALVSITLLDINGDGKEELITREGDTDDLHVYTIREGALWNLGLDSAVSHICQGGILEVSDEEACIWEYYRCTPTGVESVEKILRDPYTLYWSHASSGEEPETIPKEAAMAIRDSYRRLQLEMKPFGEYPLS